MKCYEYLKTYKLFCVTVFLIYNKLLYQRLTEAREATPHSHPYVVSIFKRNSEYNGCAGALISEDFVITVAQCVVGDLIDVVLGAHNIKSLESEKQVIEIPERYKIVHPLFNKDTAQNDIALLKLPENIEFTTNIQKINMAPENSELFNGEKAVFTGWGIQDLFFQKSKLRQVEITVLGNCNRFFRVVESTEICASPFIGFFPRGGHAGSPLIVKKDDSELLIGLASNKSTPINFVLPVFTRISSYRGWIDESMTNEALLEPVPSTTPFVERTTSPAARTTSSVPRITYTEPRTTSSVPRTTFQTPKLINSILSPSSSISSIVLSVPNIIPLVPSTNPPLPSTILSVSSATPLIPNITPLIPNPTPPVPSITHLLPTTTSIINTISFESSTNPSVPSTVPLVPNIIASIPVTTEKIKQNEATIPSISRLPSTTITAMTKEFDKEPHLTTTKGTIEITAADDGD